MGSLNESAVNVKTVKKADAAAMLCLLKKYLDSVNSSDENNRKIVLTFSVCPSFILKGPPSHFRCVVLRNVEISCSQAPLPLNIV